MPKLNEGGFLGLGLLLMAIGAMWYREGR